MVNCNKKNLKFKEIFYETGYRSSHCIGYSVRQLADTEEDMFIEQCIDGLDDNGIDYLPALLQNGEIENICNLFCASSEYENHFDDSPDGSAPAENATTDFS